MIITPLAAQTASTPSTIMSMMPILIIFVVMYFLVIRPQSKRAKEHKDMIASVKRGDRVVALGGVVGVVVNVLDEAELEIETGGSQLRILKSSVNQIVSKPEPRTEKKDAKAAKLKVVKKK
ncbi:MAG: preprotein translocase subunit YajC [Alphaproteobacteria bacterium]|nr:MAG: preprotein translocase subunit YajC [Alphaproteobacteria bacterium]